MTDTEVRLTSSTGGQKGSKEARYDLIPAAPLNALARVYGRGALKYEDRNWERGYDWSLSFAALNRHLWAFWNGEDLDEELGLPHMASVAWHAFVLLQFMEEQRGFDNRPQPVEFFVKHPTKEEKIDTYLSSANYNYDNNRVFISSLDSAFTAVDMYHLEEEVDLAGEWHEVFGVHPDDFLLAKPELTLSDYLDAIDADILAQRRFDNP